MNHTGVEEHETTLLEVDTDGPCDDPMDTEGELTVINPSDDEDDEGGMSSEGSNDVSQDGYNENNEEFMVSAMGEEVTAQLAAAGWQKQHLHGPVGMAAAAAIVSSKKRKRLHSFETNPSIRKRQQNRLLRKLRQTIDEFSTRVGMQAVVLLATPGKENTGFKVFGAKPLEDVIRTMKGDILAELETALSQHAPPQIPDDPSLYELPPLVLDGIPTPVEKMTQAQLRAFIPLMLKYSTGRGKPGWGRESTKPPWWPIDLPWANVRMDARTEEEKQRVSWTRALRQIVLNCYKYHGREDLLPTFNGEEEIQRPDISASPQPVHTPNNATSVLRYTPKASPPSPHSQNTVSTHYTQTVLQTYTNPDGTVSIIQVDPNHPIITLPDGTTAHVQGLATIHTGQNGHDQSLNDVGNSSNDNVTSVDLLNNVTEATLNQDGQLILTGEDGHGYPVSVSGMLSVPVSGSMYQTVVANIQHISNDGSLQVTPVMQVPKSDPSDDFDTNEVETITVAPHQVITMSSSSDSQVLQVISIKNASDLKTITSGAVNQQIKIDEEMIEDQ